MPILKQRNYNSDISCDTSVSTVNNETNKIKLLQKKILTQIEIINLPYAFDDSNNNILCNDISTEDNSTYYSFQLYLSNNDDISFMTCEDFQQETLLMITEDDSIRIYCIEH